MVLLMRSRLRMRPRSFSIRMPSSSSYWRLILRRPASSLGSSSWPSSACVSSPSPKMLKPFDFDPDALSDFGWPFRVRGMLSLGSSAGALGVAAGLLAHPEEAAGTEPDVLDHSALCAAARTQPLPRHVAALLCCLGFLLCHRGRR